MLRREDLEDIIRAAAAAARVDDIVVVGSQAILAQFPDAPESLLTSQEVDVYPRRHPERAHEIERALGELGYRARGVRPERVNAPAGWRERLIPVRLRGDATVTGWCMEVHDLVLARCAAGRESDWDFAREAIRHGLVRSDELLRRASDLQLTGEHRRHLVKMLRGVIAGARASVDR